MRSNFPYMMYRVRWTNLCGLVSNANIVANKIDLISCKRQSNVRCSLMKVVSGAHIETEYKHKQQSTYGGILRSQSCGWSIVGEMRWDRGVWKCAHGTTQWTNKSLLHIIDSNYRQLYRTQDTICEYWHFGWFNSYSWRHCVHHSKTDSRNSEFCRFKFFFRLNFRRMSDMPRE